MKNKFEAVKVEDPDPNATGWEVKAKQGGYWFTICDTFAFGGNDAKENAERIARLLNEETPGLTLGQLSLVKSILETIMAEREIRQGFGVTMAELNPLLRAVEKQMDAKL